MSAATITASRPPLFDPAEVRRAFTLLVPAGGVAEVRALEATHAADRYPGIWYGYFTDPDALVRALGGLRSAEGVYVTLNPVNEALLARAANRLKKAGRKGASVSDGDVVRRRWMLVDLDPRRPSGISSSAREHGLAVMRAQVVRDELAAEGWPEPALADSANGAHLLYPVHLPADDGGLVARCLAALQARFGDDPDAPAAAAPDGVPVVVDLTTANAARITKLYGTRGCKGDDVPDRPHRLSRLLEAPAELAPVPVELLEALAATAPKPAAPKAAKASRSGSPRRNADSSRDDGGFDLATWIERHRLDVAGPEAWTGRGGSGQRWVFATCPWNADHADGSAYVLQFDGGGVAAGCHHNGCSSKGWHDLRDAVEPGWRVGGRGAETNSRKDATPAGAAAGGVVSTVDAPQERKTKPGEPADGDVWVGGDRTEDAAADEAAPEYVPFPLEVLPSVVATYVAEAAAALDCDPAYVAVPMLASLASAVGNTRRVRLKRD
ncbi:MAG TPA: hypothetical protein VF796_19255, partial [Humisphaera sp.]